MKHITRCWWPLAFPVATAIWLFVVLPIYYGGITLVTLNDVWDVVVKAFTGAAPVVTAASAAIALAAFLANRRNQKEALLQRAYFDYAKMAVDNPELAFPFKSKIDLEKETLNGDKIKFEKYEWFLSSMLVMSLFVTNMKAKNRKLWKGLVINQMSYHWQYIEHFWDEKSFIINWRQVLEAEMREGIEKGKVKYRPKGETASWDEAV
jgi:hypothetical protein